MLTRIDVQRIRQRAIFNAKVTRSEVIALCEDWLAMHQDDPQDTTDHHKETR